MVFTAEIGDRYTPNEKVRSDVIKLAHELFALADAGINATI